MQERPGYVPDAATAIKVAQAVLVPIYGEKRVRVERPFTARLEGNTWIVKGTLPHSKNPNYVVLGGTMVAEIDRETGRINAVYHTK
jgi:hypothetical protein